MGEWVSIKIKKLELTTFKNYIDNKLTSLFFSEDCLMVKENVKYDPKDDEEEPHTQYLYKTNVRNAKERFDALGFTTKRFKEIFEERGFLLIDFDSYPSKLKLDFDDFEEISKQRYNKNVTYKKWSNSLKNIIKFELLNGNIRYHFDDRNKLDIRNTTECDKQILSVLDDYNSETNYSYGLRISENEYPFLLRQILDFCDDNDEIELDFSNLQYWDYDCIPKARELSKYIEKTIILVEGTSDKDMLEFSLEYLYPHLKDLFYFMDFDSPNGAKRDGGCSFLIKNMKTFYFSKLKSRFIAIFDNDAEGYQSKKLLLNEIKDWPSNMKILCYPELNKFKKYKAISPNGKIELTDINKKAGSIELYLPDFFLKEGDELFPIIWESRKEIKVGKNTEYLYQGVIQNKEDIKKEFIKYRNKVRSGKETIDIKEWGKMKELLSTIIFAFKQ